ncbi:MAG: hypothetical protein H6851_02240 [Geminicoccaceae bacterium]|nr:hypothetical protein [Geminicoccaceae bacterium]
MRQNRQIEPVFRFHLIGKLLYRGVLVSYCLNIYDDLTPSQQNCYVHHLKKISGALAGADAGSAWLLELRGLLKGAMALKAAQGDLPAGQFANTRRALDASADRLLAISRPGGGARIRKRIAKQRDHLFAFLALVGQIFVFVGDIPDEANKVADPTADGFENTDDIAQSLFRLGRGGHVFRTCHGHSSRSGSRYTMCRCCCVCHWHSL